MKMTPEERKEYNKKYYAENKDKLLEKATAKVACECCGRTVNYNNIIKHQNSSICKRKTEHLIEIHNRMNPQ